MGLIPAAYAADASLQTGEGAITPLIYGELNGYVRPVISFSKGWNWDTTVYFASTKVSTNEWWLCVTNQVGCKVRLWTPDGTELKLIKPDISAVFHLPHEITMSNLLEFLRHGNKGPQLATDLYISPNAIVQAYEFRLGKFFDIRSDQEYKLEITPMLYKARIKSRDRHTANYLFKNGGMADLVEFPPFELKLLTNGNVVSLKSSPP